MFFSLQIFCSKTVVIFQQNENTSHFSDFEKRSSTQCDCTNHATFPKMKAFFSPFANKHGDKKIIISEKYLFKSCNDIVDTYNMSIPTILWFDMSDNFINIFLNLKPH